MPCPGNRPFALGNRSLVDEATVVVVVVTRWWGAPPPVMPKAWSGPASGNRYEDPGVAPRGGGGRVSKECVTRVRGRQAQLCELLL